MTNKVGIEVGAKDNASGPLDNIRDKLDKLKKAGPEGAAIGIAAAASAKAFDLMGTAIQGAVGFLEDSITKSREEEAGIARLDQALSANIQGWNGNRDAIEQVIAAREKLAFSDGEQRDALAQLVTRTHDVNKALDLEREAMDLARLKGIDLATSSEIIGKVYGGNIGILARYGIAVNKGASATEALAQIQKAAAGQAEKYGSTTQGEAESLQIAFDDLEETVGGLIDGPLKDLVKAGADDVRTLNDMTTAAKGFLDSLPKPGASGGSSGGGIDINPFQSLASVVGNVVTSFENMTGRGITLQDQINRVSTAAATADVQFDHGASSMDDWTTGADDASRAARNASFSTYTWDKKLKDLGPSLASTAGKTDEFRDAISKLIVEEGIASEDTGSLKRAFSEAKIQMQLDIDKLHELERIKQPTKEQRLDILKTKDAIKDDRDAAREAETKLYDMGKITFAQLVKRLAAIGIHIDANIIKAEEFNRAISGSDVNRPNVGGGGSHGRAIGGPVLPGNTYTVGEYAPETLIMGANGGMVIADGGRRAGRGDSGITINMGGVHLHGPADAGSAHAFGAQLADSITATLRQQRARQA